MSYSKNNLAWLGIIPDHWQVLKLRQILAPFSEKNHPDMPLLSVVREKGVIIRNVESKEENHNYVPDDLSNYKLVKQGQFAMNKMKAWQGSYGVSKYDGIVSPAYFVFDFKCDINRAFFNVAIRSKAYVSYFGQASDGIRVGQWDLSMARMKDIPFLVPPREEQDQIVRFLDWKVSSINKLINIKRKEIQLLAEQQKALVTHTTHYGLSEIVSLKKTGFAWIGEIPSHWHLRPFSKIADVRTNLVSPLDHLDDMHISPASIEKNTGRIIGTQKVSEAGVTSNNHMFLRGQLLYSKVRPLLNKVSIAPFDGLCSADMYPIETMLDTRYLKYYMLSENFLCQLSMTGNRVKMPKINQDELSTVMIAFPEKNEQIAIADYLDGACDRIQSLKIAIEGSIDSLQELKNKLTSDTVTGKIDVRNIEIPEYEFVEEAADADVEDDGEEETEEQED